MWVYPRKYGGILKTATRQNKRVIPARTVIRPQGPTSVGLSVSTRQNARCNHQKRSGLSPRVRRNLGWTFAHTNRVGSIPAYARNACACGKPEGLSPRVRRNHDTRGRRGAWDGLSPCMRRNRLLSESKLSGRGSIPARAGEPGLKSVLQLHLWVYPRVRGGAQRSNLHKLWVYPRVREGSRCT